MKRYFLNRIAQIQNNPDDPQSEEIVVDEIQNVKSVEQNVPAETSQPEVASVSSNDERNFYLQLFNNELPPIFREQQHVWTLPENEQELLQVKKAIYYLETADDSFIGSLSERYIRDLFNFYIKLFSNNFLIKVAIANSAAFYEYVASLQSFDGIAIERIKNIIFNEKIIDIIFHYLNENLSQYESVGFNEWKSLKNNFFKDSIFTLSVQKFSKNVIAKFVNSIIKDNYNFADSDSDKDKLLNALLENHSLDRYNEWFNIYNIGNIAIENIKGFRTVFLFYLQNNMISDQELINLIKHCFELQLIVFPVNKYVLEKGMDKVLYQPSIIKFLFTNEFKKIFLNNLIINKKILTDRLIIEILKIVENPGTNYIENLVKESNDEQLLPIIDNIIYSVERQINNLDYSEIKPLNFLTQLTNLIKSNYIDSSIDIFGKEKLKTLVEFYKNKISDCVDLYQELIVEKKINFHEIHGWRSASVIQENEIEYKSNVDDTSDLKIREDIYINNIVDSSILSFQEILEKIKNNKYLVNKLIINRINKNNLNEILDNITSVLNSAMSVEYNFIILSNITNYDLYVPSVIQMINKIRINGTPQLNYDLSNFPEKNNLFKILLRENKDVKKAFSQQFNYLLYKRNYNNNEIKNIFKKSDIEMQCQQILEINNSEVLTIELINKKYEEALQKYQSDNTDDVEKITNAKNHLIQFVSEIESKLEVKISEKLDEEMHSFFSNLLGVSAEDIFKIVPPWEEEKRDFSNDTGNILKKWFLSRNISNKFKKIIKILIKNRDFYLLNNSQVIARTLTNPLFMSFLDSKNIQLEDLYNSSFKKNYDVLLSFVREDKDVLNFYFEKRDLLNIDVFYDDVRDFDSLNPDASIPSINEKLTVNANTAYDLSGLRQISNNPELTSLKTSNFFEVSVQAIDKENNKIKLKLNTPEVKTKINLNKDDIEQDMYKIPYGSEITLKEDSYALEKLNNFFWFKPERSSIQQYCNITFDGILDEENLLAIITIAPISQDLIFNLFPSDNFENPLDDPYYWQTYFMSITKSSSMKEIINSCQSIEQLSKINKKISIACKMKHDNEIRNNLLYFAIKSSQFSLEDISNQEFLLLINSFLDIYNEKIYDSDESIAFKNGIIENIIDNLSNLINEFVSLVNKVNETSMVKINRKIVDSAEFIDNLNKLSLLIPKFFSNEKIEFTEKSGLKKILKNIHTNLIFIKNFDFINKCIDVAQPKNEKLYEFDLQLTPEIKFEVLRTYDLYAFKVGIDTNCCQRIGGAGQSAAIDSFINPLASVLLCKVNDEIISQSYFHYVPNDNGLILDNVESSSTVTNKYAINEQKLSKIYSDYVKIIKEKLNLKYVLCGGGVSMNKIDGTLFANVKKFDEKSNPDPRNFEVEKLEHKKRYTDFNYGALDLTKPSNYLNNISYEIKKEASNRSELNKFAIRSTILSGIEYTFIPRRFVRLMSLRSKIK